jgi:hypothetical protein
MTFGNKLLAGTLPARLELFRKISLELFHRDIVSIGGIQHGPQSGMILSGCRIAYPKYVLTSKENSHHGGCIEWNILLQRVPLIPKPSIQRRGGGGRGQRRNLFLIVCCITCDSVNLITREEVVYDDGVCCRCRCWCCCCCCCCCC